MYSSVKKFLAAKRSTLTHPKNRHTITILLVPCMRNNVSAAVSKKRKRMGNGMAPSPEQSKPSGQSKDATKEQQRQLAQTERRRRQNILAMHTTTVQETPSVGEIILPYLFAAMETCWIDAVFIGLASLNFFQSHNPLMPLWAPFLLIIGSQWLLGYLERRNAASGDSTDSTDGTDGSDSPVEEEKSGITV